MNLAMFMPADVKASLRKALMLHDRGRDEDALNELFEMLRGALDG